MKCIAFMPRSSCPLVINSVELNCLLTVSPAQLVISITELSMNAMRNCKLCNYNTRGILFNGTVERPVGLDQGTGESVAGSE